MAAPPLRIPLGLDTQSFAKSIGEAKSQASSMTQFIVKEFAQTQLKLVVNSDEFKPAVQAATKFVGDQFAKIKPEIQAFTQSTVKETTEAGLKVAGVLGAPAIKGGFQAFTSVGVPAVTGLAQAMLPLALRAVAVYQAVNLVGEAIGAARNQIADMVAVADKASKLNVSPQFLQLFEGEARKLKITTDELDAALSKAFDATKEKSPIDVSKFEVAKERITDVELALRVYNAELEKSGGRLEGLVLFRDAGTQEEKVRAILQSMVELDKAGQHLASLDVGEKMFGSQFVDRIRQGKTSAEGILATMDKLKASGDGIFPNELVQRAKAVDDQLKLSQDRLTRAMKPALDDLAATILTIKGYWADVIDLIAKGVEYANQLESGIKRWELNAKKDELKAVNEAIKNGTGIGGIPQVPTGVTNFLGMKSPQDRLKTRSSTLQGEIDSAERALLNTPEGPEAPKKASRGTGAAPTLRGSGDTTESAGAFDRAADSIGKHTAKLEADTKAVGLGEGALQQYRAEAQLLTAAQQAGLPVTEEMKNKIEALAKGAGTAAEALAKAKIASETAFTQGSAFLTAEDLQIAQQLRGIYGTDIPAALASAEAAAMRTANAMKQLSDLGQDVNKGLFVDFTQNIRNGASAMEAFEKAGTNALGKIADKLASMAADNLWKSAFGGSSGSVLSSLFGSSSSTSSSTGLSLTGTGGLYADGGYTGNGGRNQPAGIVHRGEYVFDQDAVNRIGVNNLQRLQRGYASGGLVGGPQIVPNDIVRGGSGTNVTIGGSSIVVQGNADERTLAIMSRELARRDNEMYAKTVENVRMAKKARAL